MTYKHFTTTTAALHFRVALLALLLAVAGAAGAQGNAKQGEYLVKAGGCIFSRDISCK